MAKIAFVSAEPQKWDCFITTLGVNNDLLLINPKEKLPENVSIFVSDDVKIISFIKSNYPECPSIVFLSDKPDLEIEIQARRAGATDVITAPFNEELLNIRLNKIIDVTNLMKTHKEFRKLVTVTQKEISIFQEGMSELMAEVVESRDENTGGHIKRTAVFISILAQEFVDNGTLSYEQHKMITQAAPLHDIGKVAIHDQILLKPGPLSATEREEMKRHTIVGADLIKKMQKKFSTYNYLQYAYDITLNHHECFDGSGYPNGKKGEEIPFGARLMSVVDVYDALISDRIYRKGIPKEKALDIIYSGSGKQFDPEVVEQFKKIEDLFDTF